MDWSSPLPDGASWVPLETVTQTENSWTEVSFLVSDFVSLSSNVRLRFIAEDGSDFWGVHVDEHEGDQIILGGTTQGSDDCLFVRPGSMTGKV